MPQLEDSPLLVRLELLGRETTTIESWSIDSSYLTSTDGFEFTLYDTKADLLKGLELQPVELLVGDSQQALGRIEVTERGDNGRAVHCEGRDYISDIVECNVDPALKLTDGMSLGEAVVEAAGPCGITKALGDSSLSMRNVRTGVNVGVRGSSTDFTPLKLKEYKPEQGLGIYEFLNKIVARHGATMQPAQDRETILLTAPQFKQDPIGELVRTDELITSGRNRIIRASARRDFSRFPTYALFTNRDAGSGTSSKGASQSFDASTFADAFQGELAEIFQETVIPGRRKPGNATALGLGQLYRLLTFRDKEARNSSQLEKSALRAIAERLKETLIYSCTVRGHRDPDTGAIYSVDTIVQIEDSIANVFEPLWIASRKLKFSPTEGATTDLECWRPGAFQI